MLRTVAVSLLALAAAGAADDIDAFFLEEGLPWVDIRLGYGFVPRAESYDTHADVYAGADFDYSFTSEGDTAEALSYTIIGGSMNPLGLIGGGELLYTWDTAKVLSVSSGGVTLPVPAPGTPVAYKSFGCNMLLGAGLALSNNFHLEALGLLGIAAVDMDTSDGFNKTDGEGWSWTAGVRGGAYFTWRRLVLGAAVEWTTTELDFETNWANGNTRSQETVSGVGGRIEIGYHIQ